MEIKRTIKDDAELQATLIQLSQKHNGAWVFIILPFSHEVTFKQYRSPSRVPDYYKDLTRNRIAYKGKLRGFTQAACRREQNRGMGSR